MDISFIDIIKYNTNSDHKRTKLIKSFMILEI